MNTARSNNYNFKTQVGIFRGAFKKYSIHPLLLTLVQFNECTTTIHFLVRKINIKTFYEYENTQKY